MFRGETPRSRQGRHLKKWLGSRISSASQGVASGLHQGSGQSLLQYSDLQRPVSSAYAMNGILSPGDTAEADHPRGSAPMNPPRSDGAAISDTTPYPMAIVAYVLVSLSVVFPHHLQKISHNAPAPPALCNILRRNSAVQLVCTASAIFATR